MGDMTELKYDSYYRNLRGGKTEVEISKRDLTMLCDWLAYYGTMDNSMNDHYGWLVVALRDKYGLKSAGLLPE